MTAMLRHQAMTLGREEPPWAQPVPLPEPPVSRFDGGERWGFPEPQWSREMRENEERIPAHIPIEHGASSLIPRRPFVRRPPTRSIPGPATKVMG